MTQSDNVRRVGGVDLNTLKYCTRGHYIMHVL